MASIPCAAYQAGHIHDHLRKQHRYDVRVRAASVASDPSQPAQPKAAVITTEEISRTMSTGFFSQLWKGLLERVRSSSTGSADASLPTKEPPASDLALSE